MNVLVLVEPKDLEFPDSRETVPYHSPAGDSATQWSHIHLKPAHVAFGQIESSETLTVSSAM